MEVLYQAFVVMGVINSTVEDGGITSTEAEKRTIKSILISVSAYAGNLIKITLDREDKAKIYDYVLNTHAESTATKAGLSTIKIIEIPLGTVIPVGQTLKVAIQSGATATNIYGAYIYEIA